MILVVHGVVGFLAALAVFLFGSWASGERSFSLPTAPVVVGFVCANAAHFVSPWATPVVLLAYGLGVAGEVWRVRRGGG